MLLSIALTIVGFVPLLFMNGEPSVRWIVFPLSAIQGLGLIIMLNTATSLISDVIGNDSANAAFVYGVYSLFDKVANGLLLFFLVKDYNANASALKWIMAIIPIFCSVFATIFTYMGHLYFSNKMAKITGM